MAHVRLASFAVSILFAGAVHAHGVTGLGKVNFPNSCSPAVQEQLQGAIAMLHSFYYSAAKRAGTQLQSDQTYAAWLKAAGILEQQFKKHPHHPGVAHYLIHSYDAPPIAQKGMEAARRYAEIAPDAPHALHMPSHIFTRVGEWADSVATNLRSAAAATKAKEPDQAAHALDYAAYAYLQLARDSEARKITEEVLAYQGFNTNIFTGSYAAAAMPARMA